jgi:hypothetical protein
MDRPQNICEKTLPANTIRSRPLSIRKAPMTDDDDPTCELYGTNCKITPKPTQTPTTQQQQQQQQ